MSQPQSDCHIFLPAIADATLKNKIQLICNFLRQQDYVLKIYGDKSFLAESFHPHFALLQDLQVTRPHKSQQSQMRGNPSVHATAEKVQHSEPAKILEPVKNSVAPAEASVTKKNILSNLFEKIIKKPLANPTPLGSEGLEVNKIQPGHQGQAPVGIQNLNTSPNQISPPTLSNNQIPAPISVSFELEHSQYWQTKHILFYSPLLNDQSSTTIREKKSVFEKCQMIITESKKQKKWLTDTISMQSDVVDFIYPHYRRDFFNNQNSKKQRLDGRSFHNLSPDAIVVGAITSQAHDPNVFVSFKNIFKDTSQLQLLTVDEHSPQLADQHQLAHFFHCLDLYIQPYEIHSFSIYTLYAMACGLPVITNNNDLASEIIFSKQAVTKNCEVNHLSQVILELTQQKDWLSAVGRQNAEVAPLCEERYYLNKLSQIFKEGLNT